MRGRLTSTVRARRVLVAVVAVVASLAAGTNGVSGVAGAQDTEKVPPPVWTSLVATPITSARPVLGADGRIHLTYELLVTNVSPSVMTFDRLETLDASKGHADVNTESGNTVVATLEGADLEAATQSLGRPNTVPVGPFQVTRLFLDATFAKNATLPTALEHRFQITLEPAAGTPPVTSATVVSGRTKVANARAVVVGPPLAGPRWVDSGGCCFPPSYHRTATLPINGKLAVPERFATDFLQLNPENKLYAGPQDQLSSYAYQGAKVLAVADGTVVDLQDGRPDETPPNFPEGYTLLEALGNFVVVDIGHGRFAFSTHFQPNTLKVKVGDKVRRGQVLALMGNSGNSDAPHLHFAILDGPSPFSSYSLPFVFSSFTTTGTITNAIEDIQSGAAAEIAPAQAGPHRNELPLENDVITFPKQ